MLSLLIQVGGNDAYGLFWRLQELYLEAQIHKPNTCDSFIINEGSLVKELGINRRRLPKVIDMFSETCAIQFKNNPKTIRNVLYNNWHITLPKALIFMNKRNQKNAHIELEQEIELDKELDLKDCFMINGQAIGNDFYKTVLKKSGNDYDQANRIFYRAYEAKPKSIVGWILGGLKKPDQYAFKSSNEEINNPNIVRAWIDKNLGAINE